MKYVCVILVLVTSTICSDAIANSCSRGDHAQAVQKMAENYFDQIDLNGDQTVDVAEFERSQISEKVKSFDTLQPDVDGLVRRKTFIEAFVKAHSDPDAET